MTRTFSLTADSEKLRLPGRRKQCDRSIVPNVSLSIACFDVRNHSLLSENRQSLCWRNLCLVITSNRSVTRTSLLQFELLLGSFQIRIVNSPFVNSHTLKVKFCKKLPYRYFHTHKQRLQHLLRLTIGKFT